MTLGTRCRRRRNPRVWTPLRRRRGGSQSPSGQVAEAGLFLLLKAQPARRARRPVRLWAGRTVSPRTRRFPWHAVAVVQPLQPRPRTLSTPATRVSTCTASCVGTVLWARTRRGRRREAGRRASQVRCRNVADIFFLLVVSWGAVRSSSSFVCVCAGVVCGGVCRVVVCVVTVLSTPGGGNEVAWVGCEDGSIVEAPCPLEEVLGTGAGTKGLPMQQFHQGAVRAIACSANGVFYLTCADDGSIFLTVATKTADKYGAVLDGPSTASCLVHRGP